MTLQQWEYCQLALCYTSSDRWAVAVTFLAPNRKIDVHLGEREDTNHFFSAICALGAVGWELVSDDHQHMNPPHRNLMFKRPVHPGREVNDAQF